MCPQTIPLRRIPRPPWRTGLQEGMQLPLKEFKEITTYVHALARAHLREDLSYRQQDPASIAKIREKAIEVYPILSNRYDDAWPIDNIVKRHLQQSSFLHRHKSYYRNLKEGRKTTSSINDRVCSPSLSGAASSSRISQDAPTSLRSPSSSCEGPSIHTLPDITRIHEDITSLTPWAMLSATQRPVGSFNKFLRSCRPSLEHLASSFERMAGLATEWKFRGLLDWPEGPLYSLLKDDMRLSQSECEEVFDALAYLRQTGVIVL
ncbi:uncharacterized protein LAESUDRAFT_709900 [Laetiporus sulphureus 93-53]|uniref:Uncharacterized protein n=1 Tax=Laetiporus sulphureus 93-53 TaxID=1314785 RepID=A0A165I7R7_9APHY|nr:uncharacterized protein LAESUDRAFT_709900 [Laetiporus sulphureus 93-53]KZT12696.1 hypothetical protein LAESUDRAFT_709900 [Laetiporus sulphureus 93-53]